MLDTTTSATERAWAAGFFDGEGSVYSGPQKTASGVYPKITVNLGQVKGGEVMTKRFQKALGGLGRLCSTTWRGNRRNETATWIFSTTKLGEVQTIFGYLWPYLGEVKKQQFKDAMAKYLEIFNSQPRKRRLAGVN